MKHSLSLLCLAALSYLFPSHNATALSLSELDPTPVELNSASVSDDVYQTAGIYHIVDYSKKMESFYGKRVNEDGKEASDRKCEAYGFVSQCADGGVGTKVVPIPGLNCWKDCKSCRDFGLYDHCMDKNILATGASARHPLPGLNCYNWQTDCKCPSEYKYQQGLYSCTLGGDVCYTLYTSAGVRNLYTECTCGSQYKYLGEPNAAAVIGNRSFVKCVSPATVGGSSCSFPGTGLYQLAAGGRTSKIELYTECTCPSGYTFNNGTCVAQCTDYPLTVCPEGCNCSSCADTSATKYKIDSAKPSWGIASDGKTCNNCDACPAGYTAGVTTCDSASTTPNYHQHATAQSCGKVCGYCSCDNIVSTCTAANYPLSSIPANANYSSCNTGCGSDKVTRYKITSCKSGYELKNGICERPTTPTLPTSDYIQIAVNAPSNNTTLNFALEGSGYKIYWGDNTVDSNSSHTYEKAGDYVVTMSSGITSLKAQSSTAKITKLSSLDMNTIKTMQFSKNCDKLTGDIPEFPYNLSDATEMFKNCTGLEGDIPEFYNLEIGTDMFNGCTGLNGFIYAENNEFPSSLKKAERMFYNCENLTGPIPDLHHTKITDGTRMFDGCKNLTGDVPILPSTLEVANEMFAHCSNLDGFICKIHDEEPSHENCLEPLVNLQEARYMFAGDRLLQGMIPELPDNLRYAKGMFGNCKRLTGGIPYLPNIMYDASSMFFNCIGLNGTFPSKLPDSLTNASQMFQGCSGLTGPIPDLPTTLRFADRMFQGCARMTSKANDVFPDLPGNLEDGSYMFQGCTRLTGEVTKLPYSLTYARCMFANASNLYIAGDIAAPSSLMDTASPQCLYIFHSANGPTRCGNSNPWSTCHPYPCGSGASSQSKDEANAVCNEQGSSY